MSTKEGNWRERKVTKGVYRREMHEILHEREIIISKETNERERI